MVVPIVPFGTPVLRQKGAKVEKFGPQLGALVRDLLDTLAASETGIGLAAQQIGHAAQVCVVDLREVKPDFTYTLDGGTPPMALFMPLVLVNPELDFPPGRTCTVEEGCLSFPDIRGPVSRQELVRVKFQDANGGRHELVCDGLFGRCIQHEVDHLNGMLFIDRMPKSAYARIEKRVDSLKKATRKAAKANEGDTPPCNAATE